jgi:two-component system LytT family response regulator
VLKALIVDDEPKLAEVLALKIRDHTPQLKVVGKARNVSEAREMIEEERPDVVFLDIRMPGGSGFSLMDHFPKPDFAIIFVTGYDEYALDAFKVSAVDYLLKPVRTKSWSMRYKNWKAVSVRIIQKYCAIICSILATRRPK